MKLTDVPLVVEIAMRALREGPQSPRTGANMAREFKPSPYRLVAELNGEVVGFALSRHDPVKRTYHVGWLAVDPRYWRQGIGRRLMVAHERLARKARCRRMMLGTVYARKFYEKCGFRLTRSRPALARDIIGQYIEPVRLPEVQRVHLAEVRGLVTQLKPREARAFMGSYYEAVVSDPEKTFLWRGKDGIGGVIVAHTGVEAPQLVKVLHLRADDTAKALALLGQIEHCASGTGKHYVCIRPTRVLRRAELEHRGYRERQLRAWYTGYDMEKVLKQR